MCTVKDEFIHQYDHAWRVFEKIVEAFDENAWLHTGRVSYTPARIAFHILRAVQYYLEDQTVSHFASGKAFDDEWDTTNEDDLPSQNDIMLCIKDFQAKTEAWLSEMDFGAKNTSFEWAGETKLGVVIFLLRHTLFHLGELSGLLNEARNGDVEDYYVKA
jgi:hypothetical protein